METPQLEKENSLKYGYGRITGYDARGHMTSLLSVKKWSAAIGQRGR